MCKLIPLLDCLSMGAVILLTCNVFRGAARHVLLLQQNRVETIPAIKSRIHSSLRLSQAWPKAAASANMRDAVVLHASPHFSDQLANSSSNTVSTSLTLGLCLLASLAPLMRLKWSPEKTLSHRSPTEVDGFREDNVKITFGRRQALISAIGMTSLAAIPSTPSTFAMEPLPHVLVAGATGQTGKLTVEALKGKSIDVIAGVRNVEKAKALDVPIVQLDVTGSFDSLVAVLKGIDVVVSCIGFTPTNPFEFGKAAHAVDNLGTIQLIEAAKAAGVRRFVLMSSILTNGREIGQAKSPDFIVTNAFGGVLDEKLVAEKYLRLSGLDWVIIRPGGLENSDPKGPLAFGDEDTLFSGTVSRSNIAQVLATAAISSTPNLDRVVEVVELGTCVPKTCPADLAPAPDCPGLWFTPRNKPPMCSA